MKKLALLLAAALTLTLTACGEKASSSSAPSASSTPAASTAPVKPAAPATAADIPPAVFDTNPVVLKQFEAPTGPVATMKTSMGDIEILLFPQEAPKAVENFITHAKAGYYDGLIFHRVINDFMLQGGDPLGTGTGGESIWKKPFEDEFSDSLHNFRGALSMANSGANTNGSQFFIVQSGNKDVTGLADNLYGNLLNYQVALAKERITAKASQYSSQEQLDAYIQLEQEAINKLVGDGTTPADFAKRMEPVIAKYKEVGGTPYLDNKHTVFGQVTKGMEVVDAIAKVEKGDNDKPKEDVKILSVTIKE